MKYTIKLIAHIALVAASVYMFYCQGHLGEYNFWKWTWTIVVSLIGLGNLFLLGVATDESGSDEKRYLLGAGFLDFLIFLSICLMGLNINFQDNIFLLCCLGVYILSSGINKFTFSWLFFTGSILLFISFNSLASWHAWTVFITCILAHLVSVFCIVGHIVDEDDEFPNIEIVGLLICVGILVYSVLCGTLSFDGLMEIDRLIDSLYGLIPLCYICLAIIPSVRDNVIMSFILISAVVAYISLIVLPWVSLYSSILVGLTIMFCVFGVFVYFNFKKRMTLLLTYYYNENKKTIKQYNELAEGYNQLVELLRNDGGSTSTSTSRGTSDFERGMNRAAGSAFMHVLLDLASVLIG